MNDRFKFRLWAKDIEMYFKGPLIYINTDGKLVAEDGIKVYEIDQKAYIIEQCTGLKDKNGKLIYEGDIIYSPFDNGTKKVIFWDNYLARFMAYNRYPDKRYYQGLSSKYFIELEFEVIGNIHENADLLGEDK